MHFELASLPTKFKLKLILPWQLIFGGQTHRVPGDVDAEHRARHLHGVQQAKVLQVPDANVTVLAARDQDIAGPSHQDASHRATVMGNAVFLEEFKK